MPSRYCNDPRCADPDCVEMREQIRERDAAYLAKRQTCRPECDSLVPGMFPNPCDCGAAAKG
jgi:hypothetical protein